MLEELTVSNCTALKTLNLSTSQPVRAARRPARGASATPSTHGPPALLCEKRCPHPHRYTAKPTVTTPLPPMVFVSRLGFAAQRASAGQHCRLTEQDSAHVATAADLTALGDGGVRVARGAVLGWGGGRW